MQYLTGFEGSVMSNPFPTIEKLSDEAGVRWPGYQKAVEGTREAEEKLKEALRGGGVSEGLNKSDVSLVLFGSFGRYEMVAGSDYDWGLLVDGAVDNGHAKPERKIKTAMEQHGLQSPGSSGTFGNMVVSHDLVHRIGGGADTNANLTQRMLMLLESRPLELTSTRVFEQVWKNVLHNILERYFEEDVHITPGERKVPRFLLNDLTRYWRTIDVDYAAKHREQDGKK